jgi:D-alanine-D-alanine ligase
MHIAILYNRVSLHDSVGDLDVLKQVVVVEQALVRLGHSTTRVACHLHIDEVRATLLTAQPDVVFNLVESLGGTDQLMPIATLLLESLRLPFTGTSTLALLKTSQKLEAKNHLLMFELPTPAWITEHRTVWQGLRGADDMPEMAIVKAVSEHSSLGLTVESIVRLADLDIPGNGAPSPLAKMITRKSAKHRTPHFAEEFIDGREFNLSVLATASGPEVLPPAEIEFTDFPSDKPKIVGYDAKWNENTDEYMNTPRRFIFDQSDRPLLDELESLARRSWEVFGLRGYARVDFRVDEDGQPWILEINANPCLSPDAGFAASAAQAGLTLEAIVERILEDAIR